VRMKRMSYTRIMLKLKDSASGRKGKVRSLDTDEVIWRTIITAFVVRQ
jgi:hypothetical protein